MMNAPRQGWHEAYLGRKYRPGKYDCLDFVIQVQDEIFGKQVVLPLENLPPRVVDEDYQTGDIALFRDSRQQPHIGILMRNNGHCYLLHNNRAKRGVTAERFPEGVSPLLTLIDVYRLTDD